MNSMDVDLTQLPIPDWGLTCPECFYPLKGLPSHRCPECGTTLDMPSLVHTWTRLRAPRFTGEELPLPDFGLHCKRCDAPLVGATEHRCGACDTPFDIYAGYPTQPWFVLDKQLCGDLPVAGVQALAGHPTGAALVVVLLLDLADDGVGGQQQAGDRGGVLERDALDLQRDDHAHLDQVAVLFGQGVVAEVALARSGPSGRRSSRRGRRSRRSA
jgi:hypothetical protein